jgi:predicted permease
MQDVRYAWRGLVALPAFTIVIVLSLALGIGANTAAYTLLHAALLRALPVSQAGQLVEITTYDPFTDASDAFSYPLYTSLRETLRNHADVASVFPQQMKRISVDERGVDGGSVDGDSVNAGGGDTTVVERAVVEGASANYFSMLGVTPSEGRLFVDGDDDATGGESIAVISQAYRTRRFGDTSAPVEGRRLIIDDVPYVIVGVAARGFDGVEAQARTDIWIPVTAALPRHWVNNYGSKVLRLIARMRPDADLAQASAISDIVYRKYIVDHVLPGATGTPRATLEARHVRLRPAASGFATIGQEYRRPLAILMGSVVIVLLLCCANVANLLLARQRAREREFAVRLSLGAGPRRLARQLLIESLLLGLIGAALGLALASWTTPLLLRLLPDSGIPLALDLTPDARIFAFTAIVSLLSAVAVGLVPAWRAAHTDAGLTLTHNTRTVVRPRLSRSLVVAQLAGSLVLIAAALLMARTLQNLRGADLGFQSHQVTTFELSIPSSLPVTSRAEVYRRLVDRLSSAPGVASVTYSRESVYSTGGWAGAAAMPDQPGTKPDRQVALLGVGPRFFDTMAIARRSGRVFDDEEHRAATAANDVMEAARASASGATSAAAATAAALPIAARRIVINETMARYFFGDRSPVGQRITMDAGRLGEYEVIGVVRDVRHYGVREQPCGGRVAYLANDPTRPQGAFMVRGNVPLADLQRIVRDELQSTAPGVLLERIRPLDADVAEMVGRERMVGVLAIGFALLALTIAAVGVYGVLAYGVTQRIGEIGLRAALGAEPSTLMRMILRDALLLVAAGLAFGVPMTLVFVRVLESLLFGVTATDATTLTIAAVLLAVTAAVAAWLPARRAATIDPTSALRSI